MSGLIDLKGQTFNSLTVVSRAGSGKKGLSAMWLCQCICGNTRIARSDSLRKGKTLSCGCSNRKKGPVPKLYTSGGETMTLQQWVGRTGISKSMLIMRLNRNWSFEAALNTPPQKAGAHW